MKKMEVIPSFIWMIIGILLCVASAKLRLGSWGQPEPGLFPFLIGSAVVLLSVSQVIPQFLKKTQDERLWPSAAGLKRMLIVFVLLIFYALALDRLGFIPCTFLFFVAIFRSLGQKTWRYAFFVGLLVTISAHFVFQICLRTNLPRGFLGV